MFESRFDRSFVRSFVRLVVEVRCRRRRLAVGGWRRTTTTKGRGGGGGGGGGGDRRDVGQDSSKPLRRLSPSLSLFLSLSALVHRGVGTLVHSF